jgi:heme exporter protein D
VTHAPFILSAYAIAVAVPLFFSIQALMRARAATRKLASIDLRRERRQR